MGIAYSPGLPYRAAEYSGDHHAIPKALALLLVARINAHATRSAMTRCTTRPDAFAARTGASTAARGWVGPAASWFFVRFLDCFIVFEDTRMLSLLSSFEWFLSSQTH